MSVLLVLSFITGNSHISLYFLVNMCGEIECHALADCFMFLYIYMFVCLIISIASIAVHERPGLIVIDYLMMYFRFEDLLALFVYNLGLKIISIELEQY